MCTQKLLLTLLIGIGPCAGFAADAASSLPMNGAAGLESPAGLAASRKSLFGSVALSDQVLARHSGGTDTGPVSEMKLRGTVSDTSAVNVLTGNNLINEGALSNASGIPMVIQNSGNNVLIQNATIVNIQLK